MNQTQHKTCVIELHYLPSVQYLKLFFRYEDVVLERHEHYQKRSYRNRTKILSPQGKQLLSVPLLKGKHQQKPIAEVGIAYHTPWYAQHWHAIQTAYGSSPFFIHYGDDIRDILYQKFETLYALNRAFLDWILTQAQAPASISETGQYLSSHPDDMDDMRDAIRPDIVQKTEYYPQVFLDRLGFIEDLSALDLLMHLGPGAYQYLTTGTAQ